MTEELFKEDARRVTDMIFDCDLFAKDITRDQMNIVQKHLQFLMELKFKSYQQQLEFLDSIKELKDTK